MKFNFFKALKEGAFLNLYLANYTNEEGETKEYEILTRRKSTTPEELFIQKPDAVTIIAFSQDNKKILLQKEFRLTINDWVWSFPAGLIDNDEDPCESAKRELWEETGLTLTDVIRILPPCFTSVGATNEMIVPVYCHAKGTISKSTSAMEEIEARWFTKEEIRQLLKETEQKQKNNIKHTAFTNRVSSELYHWVGFLEQE